MLEPDCLKPKEVLEHLNALGYHDITPWQLQEFIHDLRKLIKYDQKKLRQSCNEFGSSNLQPCESECSCTESDGNSVRSSNKEYDNGSLISDCSSSVTSKGSGDSKFDDFSTKKGLDNKENFPKAQTSFIRPWNLQASKEHLSRSRRNLDPVSLYHHYKSSWKRHNIPGETNHSQLRWVIRNKMLGKTIPAFLKRRDARKNLNSFKKAACWKFIEASFNAASGSTHRTSKNLQLKHKGLKQGIRRKSTTISTETHHTVPLGLRQDKPSSAPNRTFEKVLDPKMDITELRRQILEEEYENKRWQWAFEEERHHKREIWALEKKVLLRKLDELSE